jgi:hypothetical protein
MHTSFTPINDSASKLNEFPSEKKKPQKLDASIYKYAI